MENEGTRRQRIFNRCPDVRIGDIWLDVWEWDGPTIVKGFEPQKDLPWPNVLTNKGSVGLPAFIFCEREKRGSGKSWRSYPANTPAPRKASSGGMKRPKRASR
jgi:hypothetical protein